MGMRHIRRRMPGAADDGQATTCRTACCFDAYFAPPDTTACTMDCAHEQYMHMSNTRTRCDVCAGAAHAGQRAGHLCRAEHRVGGALQVRGRGRGRRLVRKQRGHYIRLAIGQHIFRRQPCREAPQPRRHLRRAGQREALSGTPAPLLSKCQDGFQQRRHLRRAGRREAM